MTRTALAADEPERRPHQVYRATNHAATGTTAVWVSAGSRSWPATSTLITWKAN